MDNKIKKLIKILGRAELAHKLGLTERQVYRLEKKEKLDGPVGKLVDQLFYFHVETK